MKTPRLLVDELMAELIEDVSGFNDALCKVIDTMTDDKCNPLKSANAELIESLQSIALGLYKRSELIEEDKYSISQQFKEYYRLEE